MLTPQRRARFDELVNRREARSARVRAMLDRIEEHVDVLDELPKQKAEDAEEAKLGRWIHNVTEGQNELDEENRARFDALVNRGAWRRREARQRVLEVKAFVEKYGRAPQRLGPDNDPREHLLARWVEHVRARCPGPGRALARAAGGAAGRGQHSVHSAGGVVQEAPEDARGEGRG